MYVALAAPALALATATLGQPVAGSAQPTGTLAVADAVPPPPSQPPSQPPPPPSTPPPPPKPPCAYQLDFTLVIDESSSMKKPPPEGSMNGPSGLKAFAKELVHMFSLGPEAARFSVVSFADNATTRVPWSYDASEIDVGTDDMTADGRTSISDGFEVARQLLLAPRESLDGRDAAKIVLFLSDGEQTVDAAPGMTEFETALAAAATVKSLPATVFAWGYGDHRVEPKPQSGAQAVSSLQSNAQDLRERERLHSVGETEKKVSRA